MNFNESKITVTIGKAALVNPHKFIDMQQRENYTHYTAESAFEENKLFYYFEQQAKEHEFWTDCLDGEYLGSDFGEEVWQFYYPGDKAWTDENIHTYSKHRDYSKWSEYITMLWPQINTRRFRPYIGTQQTTPTTTDGGERGII